MNNGKSAIFTAPNSVPSSGVCTISLDASNDSLLDNTFKNILAVDPLVETKWKKTFGPFGGNVNKIEISPTQNNTFYIAANGGKIFKSTDGGVTWELAYDFLLNMAISDLKITSTNALYAIAIADGVYMSKNNATSFEKINTIETPTVLAKGIDSKILVGTTNGFIYEIVDDDINNFKKYTFNFGGKIESFSTYENIIFNVDIKN